MTSLNGAIEQLTAAAIIGTARSGDFIVEPGGLLGESIRSIERTSRESRLLGIAALIFPYERAAAAAERIAGDHLELAPDEIDPVCTKQAAILLHEIVDGRYRQVLPEVLQLLKKNNCRPPFTILPDLLKLCITQKSIRPDVLPILGARGRWLASQNVDWQFATAAAEDYDRSNTVDLLQTDTLNFAVAFDVASGMLYHVGGEGIAVSLPESYAPSWKQFGIEEKSWIQGVGDRTWWFIQWVSLVPPEIWSHLFQLSADRLFAVAGSTEWSDALHLAWSKGAILSKDLDWKYVVVHYWAKAADRRTSITSLRPGINDLDHLAEPLLLEILKNEPEPLFDGHPALSLLLDYTQGWTEELTLAVVSSISHRMTTSNNDRRPVWQTMALLKSSALRISPNLNDEIDRSWPRGCSAWRKWQPAVQEFHDVLSFRRSVQKAFDA